MSVHLSSWAWKQTLGDPGTKLVLVKLADNADDDGYSWWRQKRLADECEMSRATVQRKLRALAERGLVEVIERQADNGATVANGYRLTPHQIDAGTHHSCEAAPPHHSREAAEELSVSTNRQEVVPPKPPAWPSSVNRKPVAKAEGEKAVAILAEYNAVAGDALTAKSWLAKIIMRIREHPELTVEQHAEIIRRNFAAPWWKGDPSPSVIYGNDGVFENAMRATGVRTPTTREEQVDDTVRRLRHYAETGTFGDSESGGNER